MLKYTFWKILFSLLPNNLKKKKTAPIKIFDNIRLFFYCFKTEQSKREKGEKFYSIEKYK